MKLNINRKSALSKAILLSGLMLPAAFFSSLSGVQANDEEILVGYYEGDPAFQSGSSDDERKTGYAYEYLQKLAALTGWNFDYVYGTRAEVMEALVNGDIDLVAGVYQTDKRQEEVLFSAEDLGLDGPERYFAVSQDNPQLLAELDAAVEELNTVYPSYLEELKQTYYPPVGSSALITSSEQAWLADKGILKIGYLSDVLPFSGQNDNGEVTGVFADVLDQIASYTKTAIETYPFSSLDDMEQAIRDGQIDTAFPVYTDLWTTEQRDLMQTDGVISDRVSIIYKGEYDHSLLNKIGVNKTGLRQDIYASIFYPDSEVIIYDSLEDCLNALDAGEVKGVLTGNSLMQRYLSEHPEAADYHNVSLEPAEWFGFAVNPDEYPLIQILNKAISLIERATLTNSVAANTNVTRPYEFSDFIQDNALLVFGVLAAFIAILLAVFIAYRKRTSQFNEKQKKTNAALADALKAANAANEAKTTFLSGMSHDIRTPMNGIIGMTAIASAHVNDPVRVKDCLNKINMSSRHLMNLINEILDMSKIESGEVFLNEDTVNLSALVDELVVLNKPNADVKHQNFLIQIFDIEHENALGDGVRLQQVFTNLIGNAIKYTPEGGTVEITLSEKPSSSERLARYELIVEDNGVGMDKDYLPKIFDPFTRAENTQKNTQGTGLGMAISRNIIKMMDGDITVESELKKGTKVTVVFCLKIPEEDVQSSLHLEGSRILVVDDDPNGLELASEILSAMNMEVQTAASGKEALEKVQNSIAGNRPYFTVLMDWKMEGMDGVETAGEIEKLDKNLPVVIVSAYDYSLIEKEAREAGIRYFVEKPLFKTRLIHVFEQILKDDAPVQSELHELSNSTGLHGKRALLAEDNELNAEIAMEILSMSGLSVDWVTNGKEAVEKIVSSAEGYYDVIFMDVQMPVMDGLEAAKAIRALNRQDAKSMLIFAMTANAFTEDVLKAKNAGMNEHIAKPLDLKELQDILNRYLK